MSAAKLASTIAAQRKALGRLGRELRCPPAEMTADQLVASFGRQQWRPKTRRF
jgi:hypothetical protein